MVLKNLEEMQLEVQEVNLQNGWFDTNRSFGDGIALLHSEISEAVEAYRQWGLQDVTGKPKRTLKQWVMKQDPFPPKPEGVGSEFADIFIRLLDECERHDVDLRSEYERKIRYNRTRKYRHGGKSM